jgi:hypothetical protein
MNITINILTTNVLNGDRFIGSLIENSDLWIQYYHLIVSET